MPGPLPAAITVVLSGDLDLVTSSLLRERLAHVLARPQRVVFDMARVSFIDCAAARLIVSTGRSFPAGRRAVIQYPSPAVRRLLKLTGLDAHCELKG